MSELTILMPCLNEEENIAFCIEQAQKYLSSRNLSGEILVVDNDSTDRSAETMPKKKLCRSFSLLLEFSSMSKDSSA